MPRLVFFTIHRTTPWWTYLASRIDFADVTVLSDLRGEGDYSLVDDFYRFMRKGDAAAVAIARFGEDGCADIILRCRSLRSLDRDLAMRMIGGMTQAIELAFDRLDPRLLLSFTMDRYVMDVMARIASARGIDFLEMTSSPIPDHVVFHRRGQLVPLGEPSPEELGKAVEILSEDGFAPVYVRDATKFSRAQFWRVFSYFAVRGAFFNVWRFLRRDPYNLHYIDALKRLKHKVRPGDVAVLDLLRKDWQARLEAVPKERRVFIGLQLFPEASLDYWLRSQDLLGHDEVVLRYCEVLGKAGYHIIIKDHPLQFGFRQRELSRTSVENAAGHLRSLRRARDLADRQMRRLRHLHRNDRIPGRARRTCARSSPMPGMPTRSTTCMSGISARSTASSSGSRNGGVRTIWMPRAGRSSGNWSRPAPPEITSPGKTSIRTTRPSGGRRNRWSSLSIGICRNS